MAHTIFLWKPNTDWLMRLIGNLDPWLYPKHGEIDYFIQVFSLTYTTLGNHNSLTGWQWLHLFFLVSNGVEFVCNFLQTPVDSLRFTISERIWEALTGGAMLHIMFVFKLGPMEGPDCRESFKMTNVSVWKAKFQLLSNSALIDKIHSHAVPTVRGRFFQKSIQLRLPKS